MEIKIKIGSDHYCPLIVLIVRRLFYHECLRVFHDRLINIEDRSYFYHLMSTICSKNFQNPILEVPDDEIIERPPLLLFGDFLNPAVPKENRIYAEIPDIAKLMVVLKVRYWNNIVKHREKTSFLYP